MRNLIALSVLLFFLPQVTYAQSSEAQKWENAVIESITSDQSSVQARNADQRALFAVKAPEVKAALKHFGGGDRVDLTFTREVEQNVLQNISVRAFSVGKASRLWALLISALALLFLSWLLLQGKLGDLITGADNRYSNSKFQVILWFFILITIYLAATWLRLRYGGTDFITEVNIPPNLLLLSGLSALTFVTAKGITQGKIDSGAVTKTVAAKPRFPFDLFHDDVGRVDMADFQMIVVTLLAVAVYLVRGFGFLESVELHSVVTLPDVDTTILATFGLGQGAYLAKKYLGDVGGGLPLPTPAGDIAKPR